MTEGLKGYQADIFVMDEAWDWYPGHLNELNKMLQAFDNNHDFVSYCAADVQLTMALHGLNPSISTDKEPDMTIRPLDAPVDMDQLEELDTVKADPLYDAMTDAGVPQRTRDRVINILLNDKERAKGKNIVAQQLLINGYEKMARIEFQLDGVSYGGHIRDVRAITNQPSLIAITIRAGQHIDTTIAVPRLNVVRIWPVEYKDPSPAMQERGMRPLPPGRNPFLTSGFGRPGRVISSPPPRPRNVEADKHVYAQYLWDFRREYLGRRVSVKNRVSFGELTDISIDGNGKVYCVIAGKLYKFNKGASVLVHGRK